MGYICATCRHPDTRFIVHQGVVLHFSNLFVQRYNALLPDRSNFRQPTKALSTTPNTTNVRIYLYIRVRVRRSAHIELIPPNYRS